MGDAAGEGIDQHVIARIADEISDVIKAGVQVALVIGGGNILRGSVLSVKGVHRATADHMGMLATVINALALQDALERSGLQVRVMSALQINQVCENYIRRRAIRHLEKSRVVVFAAGTGNPYFTTDSAASLRGIEIDADLILKATKVDGVYDKDPAKHSDAKLYNKISYNEVLEGMLEVMDTTAIVLCRDHNIPIRVFNFHQAGALMKVVFGESIGTLIN